MLNLRSVIDYAEFAERPVKLFQKYMRNRDFPVRSLYLRRTLIRYRRLNHDCVRAKLRQSV